MKFSITRWLLPAAGILLFGAAIQTGAADDASNQRVTFYKDILPVIQENCQICHRPGGDNIAGLVAPMTFMSYQEVRPWAKSIRQVVLDRQMPPWDATRETEGLFANERTLTDEEIQLFSRWVSQGSVAGLPENAPPVKVFDSSEGWVIGKPDLIISLPEPYFVADEVEDIQPRFTFKITKEMLPEPRWLQAIEYKPDSEAVHHITGRATAPAIDGHPEEVFSLGSIAAGEDPTIYPEGFGNLLRSGTEISVSMHYHKEVGPGTGLWDQSSIGFKFHPEGVEIRHKVNWNGISNGGFEIPPGHENWEVGAARTFEKDTLFLSIHPHMHYRGKDMKYTAFYPDGTQEVLLDVDRYEYEWQTNYIYKEPKLIPAGTRVEVRAHYDNSEIRQALVPKLNINRAVSFGAASTDEMMVPFIAWTYIEPDEVAEFTHQN